MRIRTFWEHYASDDRLMPNVMLAVDEYLDDENPDYWNQQVEKLIAQAEENGSTWRIIEFTVPDANVVGAFRVPVSTFGSSNVMDGGPKT